jgi:hypothetical protein
MQFATHMAVFFFFYSFHKLEIEVVRAGILRLRTNYNTDDVQHDILARSGSHSSHGNATMPSYLFRYVAVNKEILQKSVQSQPSWHVGRGKDMTKLIPAFRGNENATNKARMYFSEVCLQLIHDWCVTYCGAYVSLSVIYIAMWMQKMGSI